MSPDSRDLAVPNLVSMVSKDPDPRMLSIDWVGRSLREQLRSVSEFVVAGILLAQNVLLLFGRRALPTQGPEKDSMLRVGRMFNEFMYFHILTQLVGTFLTFFVYIQFF